MATISQLLSSKPEQTYDIPDVRPQDVNATMTPRESFQSNVASADYAIHALSHPNDDTYRKNLARYLDTKGLDLIANKYNELYIADRNSLEKMPVTRSFIGELVGSAPELAGAIFGAKGGILGAAAGSVAGDAVQQGINSYFLGEELAPGERAFESGKSAGLGAGGELAGRILSRIITPLSGINKEAQNANEALAAKYDVPLTPATATGHDGLAKFEETMAKGTLGGKQIAKMKEDEIKGVEKVATDLLEDKMGGTGNTYDSGASFVYNVGKKQQLGEEFFTKKYGDLVKAAGVTEIPVVSLKGVAKEILDKTDKIPAFKNGIDTFAKRLLESPDSLTYEEYQQLRSYIGSKIKDASVTGQSGSKAAYKQLYGAINNDFDEVFKGTHLWDAKRALDNEFKTLYKEPFEDSFTKGVTGTSRNKIDPERIGGLIANSSGKAKTAMNTADSGFMAQLFPGGRTSVADTLIARKPSTSMSAAADYILGRSAAPEGGMSLAKVRTNLTKAKGIDQLLKKADTLSDDNLQVIKDDLIKLIELSNANRKVGNSSGTAYMNEMLRMKNDPASALLGFISDQTLARAYKTKLIQKWLTNDIIDKDLYRKLIKAAAQTSERAVGD